MPKTQTSNQAKTKARSKIKPKTARSDKERQKTFRATMLLLGIILTIAIIGVLLYGSAIVLFSGNKHFTLKHVEVRSSGWWNNRSRLMANKLGLTLGKDNLFSRPLYKMRRFIEKLPCVDTAAVSRVLPDTLRVDIIERIPRAYIGSSKSPLVVDSNCMLMERKYCLNLERDLPNILGVTDTGLLKPGHNLAEVQPAVDLIMLTKQYFPDFRIAAISVRDTDKLFVVIYYQGRKIYKVNFPRKNLKYMLAVLRSAVHKAIGNGDRRTVIDLTYKGKVIFR
ncbi:FtsQ-type POTRA domain-containing protein [Lentisphaerota bacterium ZTH]|nr:FtsQ-type POTRA domain-containing protein [Lentisphaerota bacterium]WET05658.1 FtsQ-type POTRA domain-containing protein [Lentisphaerota bacterium ZTH]